MKDEKSETKVGEKVENKVGETVGIRAPEITKKPSKNIFSNIIFIVTVNLLLVGLTIFFVYSLNAKAVELKQIRNEIINADKISSAQIVSSELQSNQKFSDALLALFPDESGLVSFISQIEKEREKGIITDFYFANPDAVKDRTGSFSVPFVLTMTGTWEQIDVELQFLQKLPFIIRTITFKSVTLPDNTVEVDYGGLIYVDDKLGKTK